MGGERMRVAGQLPPPSTSQRARWHLLSSPRHAERSLEAVRRLERGEGEEHELIER